MKILKECFGSLETGEEITKYKLQNDKNCFVSVLNYGGIINEIMVPDKDGNIENVVLGFDSGKDYEKNPDPHFGALTGRIAGRISNAKFTIDDKEYVLEKNNFNANLHSGPKGFSETVWNVKEIVEKDFAAVELSYLSPDGDQGFPGNLNVKTTYKFNNNNELEILYEAVTDKKTIVNLTNHSYFNLSGDLKEDTLNQILTIKADKFGCVDIETLPDGELRNVEETAFDFRNGKRVKTDINSNEEQIKNGAGYDHPFIINSEDKPQMQLKDEKSGRIMEISTDQPCVVLYTGNHVDESLTFANGILGKKHLGLCLETQYYPDAINQEIFPTHILCPDEKYKSCTKYKFSVI